MIVASTCDVKSKSGIVFQREAMHCTSGCQMVEQLFDNTAMRWKTRQAEWYAVSFVSCTMFIHLKDGSVDAANRLQLMICCDLTRSAAGARALPRRPT